MDEPKEASPPKPPFTPPMTVVEKLQLGSLSTLVLSPVFPIKIKSATEKGCKSCSSVLLGDPTGCISLIFSDDARQEMTDLTENSLLRVTAVVDVRRRALCLFVGKVFGESTRIKHLKAPQPFSQLTTNRTNGSIVYDFSSIHRAYGIIPYFETTNSPIRFLLIKHVKGGHWGFPKGGARRGENELQAATREMEEETGLPAGEVRTDLGAFHRAYEFYRAQKKVKKITTFFLSNLSHLGTSGGLKATDASSSHNTLSPLSTQTIAQQPPGAAIRKKEIADYKWATLQEAFHLLTFVASKQLLQHVYDLLIHEPVKVNQGRSKL